MKIVAGRVADFRPGEHRVISAGGRSIGVFRIGDRFYALNNHCPHQGGPLCSGRTVPWLRSTGPGQVEADDEVALIACPWHGWEYEIATGQSFLGPGTAPARGYLAEVESGRTVQDGLEHPSGRIPGPYVAETFEVHVDDDYVVIDTSSRPSVAHPAERTAS